MADGNFPTLISKDNNVNAATNGLFCQLTDGVDTAVITAGGALSTLAAANAGVNIGDVNVLNLASTVDAIAGAADVGVASLAVRDDVLTALVPVDGDYVSLRTNSSGALWVECTNAVTGSPSKLDDALFSVGVDTVSPSGFLADDTAPDVVQEGDVGLARMTLSRKQLMVIADPTTDANRLAIDALGNAQVDIASVSVTAVPISKDGVVNSAANPIFVSVTDAGLSATELNDYNTIAALAGGGASNHDVVVSGTTLLLKSVILSSSGGSKIEVQVGPVLTLATKAVAFVPKAGGTQQINFDPPIEVPVTGTGTVRVIRTNRQGAAQDVYTTIIGNQI